MASVVVKYVPVIVAALIAGFAGAALFSFAQPSFEYSKFVSLPETEISSYTLLQRMAANDSFLVIDSRDAEAYELGHIKGALSFTLSDLGNVSKLASLPKDKDLIVYCWSSECMLGPTLSSKLAKLGFQNIKELRIGWCEWSERGYPIDGTRYIIEGECLQPQRSVGNETVEVIPALEGICGIDGSC